MWKKKVIHILFLSVALFLLPMAVSSTLAETAGSHGRRLRTVSDSIMGCLFDAALKHAVSVKDYRGELYLKGHFKVHKQNRIVRYLPSVFRLEKGVDDYIYESVSDIHYTAPDIVDRKIRALSSTFPNARKGEIFDVIDYIHFNIYSPSLMRDRMVSPLNWNAERHYRYLLEDETYRLGETVYKIRISPRYKSTQLVEGVIWVSSKDWSVRYAEISGRYGVVGFHLVMHMGQTEETKLLPTMLSLDLDFRFLRNHLEMNYTGWMRYSDVELFQPGEEMSPRRGKSDFDLTGSYTLMCDTSRLVSDRDSFARIRPIPLTEEEDSLYRTLDYRRWINAADTLEQMSPRKKNRVFWGQIGDALISDYNLDLSKVGNISCSALINPLLVSYSHRNGISYRQVFKYNKLFHNERLLRIAPQIGYNFTKKELYAKVDMEYVYNPEKHGSIEIHAGNGNRIYSSVVLDQLEQMPDSTFSFDGLDLDYFKDIYVDVSHNIEIINGLRLWTGLSMHWRYTKSTPEVEARVRSRYNSFAPRIRLEWTPGQYYYLNGRQKVNLKSRFPTFILDYERGLKGVLKSTGAYERIEFDMQHHIRTGLLSNLYYRFGVGFFTNQNETYFVDFVNFRKSNLPEGWSDEIGGVFQALDGQWYNASNYYVRGHIAYEAPFLLLRHLIKYTNHVQNERLYLNLLTMDHLGPYLEVGYGIGTFVFDMGLFLSLEKFNRIGFGYKFTFELFNN